MSNIVPTRQPYTVDDLAALLRLDFADRGTLATVDVNEWGPEMMGNGRGSPVVVISYGDGKVTEPAGAYQDAIDIDVTMADGTTGKARPVLDDVQGYVLRIHAPAIGNSEPPALGARRATDQLMRQTLRAIRRAMAAPLREAASIEWPTKTDPDVLGAQGWTYGSLCRVRLVIASPVVDDAYGTGAETETETSAELSLDGGATFAPSDPSYVVTTP